MLVIIGCGNLTRADDGVGSWVAQRLNEWLTQHPTDTVRVYDAGTAGMEVMFQARGATSLVVVDACLTDSTPGTLFEVPGSELDTAPQASYNLHDFRWDNALYTGRRIFGEEFPADVTAFLIEAQRLDFEIGLSPAVLKSAERVYQRLLHRITGTSS